MPVQNLKFRQILGRRLSYIEVDENWSIVKAFCDALEQAMSGLAPTDSPTFTGTVAGITKAMVGLGKVSDTAPADLPISTAALAAINAKFTKPSHLGTVVANSTARLALPNVSQGSWVWQSNVGGRYDYTPSTTSGTSTTEDDWRLTSSAVQPIAAGSVLGNTDPENSALPSAIPIADLPVSGPQEARHGRLPIVAASGATVLVTTEHRGVRLLRNNGSIPHVTTIQADVNAQFSTDDWIIVARGTTSGTMTLNGATDVIIVGPEGLITESGGIYTIGPFPAGAWVKLQKLSSANTWRVIEHMGFIPINVPKFGTAAPTGDNASGLYFRIDGPNYLVPFMNGVEFAPTYTWAQAMAANLAVAANLGRVVRIKDPTYDLDDDFEVRVYGGTYRLVPKTRTLDYLLGAVQGPSAMSASFATQWLITTPAGLLFERCHIEANGTWDFTGTAGTKTGRFRIETTNMLGASSGNVNALGVEAWRICHVLSNSEIRGISGGTNGVTSGASGGSTGITTLNLAANNLTMRFGMEGTSAADTGTLLGAKLTLKFPRS